MCFYADYDYACSVYETEDRVAAKFTRCEECYRLIIPGETYRFTWGQDHEDCQRCYDGNCDCVNDDGYCDDCKCEEPDYGETFEYRCCGDCQKFLAAVKRNELEEGCDEDEAVPPLGQMVDYIPEVDHPERYFERAAKDFPELAESGYLARVYERMFRALPAAVPI